MDASFHLPDDPLERFVQLHGALFAKRPWYEGGRARRLAALVLVTTRGEPDELAERAQASARELRRRSPWHGPLRGELRHAVAAMLLRAGDDAQAFLDETQRARALFREAGLYSSGFQHVIAVLALRALRRDAGGRPAAIHRQDVERLARLRAALAADRPFLTGQDDHAACALLAASELEPERIAARLERLYRGLRELGYAAGNRLQAATHCLAIGAEREGQLVGRFDALFREFRRRGLRMRQGDYGDVALLALLPRASGEVAGRVEAHREAIAALRPRVDREASFDLACGTGFLELLGEQRFGAGAQLLQAVVHLQALLQARDAAAAAGAAAAAAAAASG